MSAVDRIDHVRQRAGMSIVNVWDCTPDDDTDQDLNRGFFIQGDAGDVTFIPAALADDSTATITLTLDPGYHDIATRRIYATGTTATEIKLYI